MVKLKVYSKSKKPELVLSNLNDFIAENGYIQLKKTLFFINPNYEIKFGLKPRILNSILAKIPYIRNFMTTCGYYIIASK